MDIPTHIKNLVRNKTPIDKITDFYEARNFLEVTGYAGGDVLTYRIYNDGMVTER